MASDETGVAQTVLGVIVFALFIGTIFYGTYSFIKGPNDYDQKGFVIKVSNCDVYRAAIWLVIGIPAIVVGFLVAFPAKGIGMAILFSGLVLTGWAVMTLLISGSLDNIWKFAILLISLIVVIIGGYIFIEKRTGK